MSTTSIQHIEEGLASLHDLISHVGDLVGRGAVAIHGEQKLLLSACIAALSELSCKHMKPGAEEGGNLEILDQVERTRFAAVGVFVLVEKEDER